MTTLKDVQQEIEKQLSESQWFNQSHEIDLTHSIIGIVEEAGELSGLLKKQYFRHKEKTDEEWIGEFGDVLWYLVAAISLKGYSLEDVWSFNCSKLLERHNSGMKNNKSWEG